MIKFFTIENVPGGGIRAARQAGFDIAWISEMASGANDETVLGLSMTAAAIYLGIVIVMSLVCFVAYGWDKRSAANGSRRVPEQTLHILALMGGWPGGLLGQRYFRHKTKKLSFLVVFWCFVGLHVAIVVTAAYMFFGNSLQ